MASALVTYLNDHLAGSVAAIELIEHGIESDEGGPIARFLSELLPEIQADQEVLRSVLLQVGGEQSSAKKAVAWLGEKISRIKRDHPRSAEHGAGLGRLIEFEILALGILGKRALWAALQQIAEVDGRLSQVDFPRLVQRADHQFALVEHQRLVLAQGALVESTPAVNSSGPTE